MLHDLGLHRKGPTVTCNERPSSAVRAVALVACHELGCYGMSGPRVDLSTWGPHKALTPVANRAKIMGAAYLLYILITRRPLGGTQHKLCAATSSPRRQ